MLSLQSLLCFCSQPSSYVIDEPEIVWTKSVSGSPSSYDSKTTRYSNAWRNYTHQYQQQQQQQHQQPQGQRQRQQQQRHSRDYTVRQARSSDTHTTVTMNANSFDSQDWDDDYDNDYNKDDRNDDCCSVVELNRTPDLALSTSASSSRPQQEEQINPGCVNFTCNYSSSPLMYSIPDDDDDDAYGAYNDNDLALLEQEYTNDDSNSLLGITTVAAPTGYSDRNEERLRQDERRRELIQAWSW